MIVTRPAGERGHFKTGWLDAWHTFSFGDYYDPDWMGFGPLRVINDDRIAAGQGFPMHGHRDMEILTVVLEGALEHRDNLGNGAVIQPGDVQKMSAGTGVLHSEFNPQPDKPTHSLQIWIQPEAQNLSPGYQQRSFPETPGAFQLLASRDGRHDSIVVYQDVALYRASLGAGTALVYDLPPGRRVWAHVASGKVALNGIEMAAGDGAAIAQENSLRLASEMPSRVLLFDLV